MDYESTSYWNEKAKRKWIRVLIVVDCALLIGALLLAQEVLR